MRRYVGYGLLLVFAYALAGIYPAQWALRSLVRNEMRRSLDGGGMREQLATFRFAWAHGRVQDPAFASEGDDEFRYNGTMYDVVCTEVHDGTIVLHCLADGAETELLQQARSLDPFQGDAHGLFARSHTVVKALGDHYLPCPFACAPMCDPSTSVTNGHPCTQLPTGHHRSDLRPPLGTRALT